MPFSAPSHSLPYMYASYLVGNVSFAVQIMPDLNGSHSHLFKYKMNCSNVRLNFYEFHVIVVDQ